MSIQIGKHKIGSRNSPFIVAEMSGNHNQSKEIAFKIVDAAAKAGVNAIKLQTYKANTMTLNLTKNEFYISDKNSLWKGQSLSNLYDKASTPWEWHKDIFDYSKKKDLYVLVLLLILLLSNF